MPTPPRRSSSPRARNPFSTLTRAFTLAAALVLVAPPAASADAESTWPQWRGPARDGSVPGADWPQDFGGLATQWRVELGKGYPGPIVGADRVYVVETVDAETVAVRALDRATGKELWKHAWSATGSVPFFARANGDWVRLTPALAAGVLYAGDMQEILVALDAASGRELWRVDFPAVFGTKVPDFGFVSSPLVDGEFLYLQAANSLIKLHKADGQVAWRVLEHSGDMMNSGSFSSPVFAELHGQRQLLVQSRHELHGVDPADGKVLWTQFVPSFRGMNILTPSPFGNAIFTSSYRESSFLYAIDRNEEGFQVREAWKQPATGYMSSPVVIDGHAYLHLGNGRLTCMDLETGESKWTSKPFGKYWSMAHQGNRILALDEDGTLYLIEANPEKLEILDQREVSEQSSWGYLAVSGDQVFVRELEAVTAFTWRVETAQEPEAAP